MFHLPFMLTLKTKLHRSRSQSKLCFSCGWWNPGFRWVVPTFKSPDCIDLIVMRFWRSRHLKQREKTKVILCRKLKMHEWADKLAWSIDIGEGWILKNIFKQSDGYFRRGINFILHKSVVRRPKPYLFQPPSTCTSTYFGSKSIVHEYAASTYRWQMTSSTSPSQEKSNPCVAAAEVLRFGPSQLFALRKHHDKRSHKAGNWLISDRVFCIVNEVDNLLGCCPWTTAIFLQGFWYPK